MAEGGIGGAGPGEVRANPAEETRRGHGRPTVRDIGQVRLQTGARPSSGRPWRLSDYGEPHLSLPSVLLTMRMAQVVAA
ncbi:hypothetical protein FRACA_510005 [Frankia canadensis]|uniref:Uncharacterized protein n=1 Tax=Frankia canadensis TaxID=1836972 RepID=A0A2I2KYH7_9ACTN|nr:hypothetical protein FRACA_510005 [Frankia canadensis]SOU57996.1 hypothetical protein FRACA_510005 [Frankia canadensis]